MAKKKARDFYGIQDYETSSGRGRYYQGEVGPAASDYKRSIDFVNSIMAANQADEESARSQAESEGKFQRELFKESLKNKSALRRENVRGYQTRKTESLRSEIKGRDSEKKFAQQEKLAKLRGEIQKEVAILRGSQGGGMGYENLLGEGQVSQPAPGPMSPLPGQAPPMGPIFKGQRTPVNYSTMSEDELIDLADTQDDFDAFQELKRRREGA